MNLQDIKEYRDKVRAAQFEAGAKMFLDKRLSNLETKLSDNYYNFIFYIFNNVTIYAYDKINNYFYYDYDKIYQVLTLEFGFDEHKIKELMVDKVEEHLEIIGVEKLISWSFDRWTDIKFKELKP